MKYITGIFCAFLITILFSSSPLTIPSVNMKTLKGETINIKKEIGEQELTIICLWANWSSPSKRQLDVINKRLPLWKENYDVELIAVNYDKKQYLPRVSSIVDQKKWNFQILTDLDKELHKVIDREFSFNGVTYSRCGTMTPHLYLVNKSGNVVFGHVGFIPGDESLIEDQLNLHSGLSGKKKITRIKESITEDQTWIEENSPYIIEKKDFKIEEGATLTVEAGVVIHVDVDVKIPGNLILLGEENKEIVIEAKNIQEKSERNVRSKFNSIHAYGKTLIANHVVFNKISLLVDSSEKMKISNCHFKKGHTCHIRGLKNGGSINNNHFEETEFLSKVEEDNILVEINRNKFMSLVRIEDYIYNTKKSKYSMTQNCFMGGVSVATSFVNTDLQNNYWGIATGPTTGAHGKDIQIKIYETKEFEVPSYKPFLTECTLESIQK